MWKTIYYRHTKHTHTGHQSLPADVFHLKRDLRIESNLKLERATRDKWSKSSRYHKFLNNPVTSSPEIPKHHNLTHCHLADPALLTQLSTLDGRQQFLLFPAGQFKQHVEPRSRAGEWGIPINLLLLVTQFMSSQNFQRSTNKATHSQSGAQLLCSSLLYLVE